MNLKFNVMKKVIYLFMCLLLASCATDMHFEFPEGPAGLSAYESWVEFINNNGDPTWEGGTDLADFFIYITGEDGENSGNLPAENMPQIINNTWWINGEDTGIPATGAPGAPGADGSNGMSAYDLWVTYVLRQGGIDDPRYDGNERWPITETSEEDFFAYLRGQKGNPGQSAYEIWKEKVMSEEGLDDPRTPELDKWPQTEADTELADFWVYLRGLKGDKGDDAYTVWKEYMEDNDDSLDTNEDGEEDMDDFWFWLKGAKGDPGESAYETWVKYINTDEDGDGDKDENDFLLWLKGAKGDPGDKGLAGQSAYEFWKEYVADGTVDDPHSDNPDKKWDPEVDGDGPEDFIYFLRGVDGDNGDPGKNGLSAYEIWQRDINTDEDSDGDKDEDDFWEYLRGENGLDGDDGEDGKSPYIGENGNWYIWNSTTNVYDDSGKPARGLQGEPGGKGEPGAAGSPGANGVDGADGADGIDGLSAYEVWKEYIKNGDKDDPRTDDSALWPGDKNTEADFWEYLRGRDGDDGKDGEPGQTGAPGDTIKVEIGYYNVIPQYSIQEYNEFVNWNNGSVTYKVYDKNQDPLVGAKIKGMPGMPADREFTSLADGTFTVPKDQLPTSGTYAQRSGTVQVSVDGGAIWEESADNTYVPQKVAIRAYYEGATSSSKPSLTGNVMRLPVRLQRRMTADGQWENHPTYIANLSITAYAHQAKGAQDASYVPVGEAGQNILYSFAGNTGTAYYDIERPIKPVSYMRGEDYLRSVNRYWDGEDHYIVMELGTYYGEKAATEQTVKLAPIQYLPVLDSMEFKNSYNVDLASFNGATVKWDVSEVDYSLFFEPNAVLNGKCYDWTVIPKDDAEDLKVLIVNFNYVRGSTVTNTTNSANPVTLANPTFTFDGGIGVPPTVSSTSYTRVSFSAYNVSRSRTMFRSNLDDAYSLRHAEESAGTGLDGTYILKGAVSSTNPVGPYNVPSIAVTINKE
jgi:hypothetical protein